MFDITVLVADERNPSSGVWRALAEARINVEGGTSFFREGHRVVHVAVYDPAPAERVLRKAGYLVADARPVLALEIDDYPLALADVTDALARAGVRVWTMYYGTASRLIVGVDDLEAARTAVAGIA